MIELEKTYLAKNIPSDLDKCKSREIIDLYIPETKKHPTLRLRKNGNKFELTKKEPVHGNDSSHMHEQTIGLTNDEYNVLKKLPGKKVSKIRYCYPFQGVTAEFDIFQEDLAGLVIVDFEFTTMKEKNNFVMPDFCLAEVTQEEFLAGGMVCGKRYCEIEKDLDRFDYNKLHI